MIVSKNVTLRNFEEVDLEIVADWRNNPEIFKTFFSYNFIIKSKQREWYHSLILKKEKILFIIEENVSHEKIGMIGLDNIDFKNQQAEFGNLIIGNESYLGKGYAKEASVSLLNYCFEELNLNRVYLKVFEFNNRAIKLYEKCGFKIEGKLRESHFSQGKFQNILIMSILRKEFVVK